MNTYIDKKIFYDEMKKSLKENKLTNKTIEYYYYLMEGIISKNRFKDYADNIKIEMGNYALLNFERYWNKFKLFNIQKNQINNPYSYFYKMVQQSYYQVLKGKSEKQFSHEIYFDPTLSSSLIEKEKLEDDELDLIYNQEDYNQNIIFDYSEIINLIEQNINKIKNENILDILYFYLNENIVYKFIQKDPIFISLLDKKYKEFKNKLNK